jgi:hypothetical protein
MACQQSLRAPIDFVDFLSVYLPRVPGFRFLLSGGVYPEVYPFTE